MEFWALFAAIVLVSMSRGERVCYTTERERDGTGERERKRKRFCDFGTIFLLSPCSPVFALFFFFGFLDSHQKWNKKRKENKQTLFWWKYKIVYWRRWYHSSFISILHTDCRKADCLRAKEGFFQQIRGFGRGCRRHFVQPGHASARRLDRRLVSLFRSKQRNERQEARDDLFC